MPSGIGFHQAKPFRNHTFRKWEEHGCQGSGRLELCPLVTQLHKRKVAPGARAKSRTLEAGKLDSDPLFCTCVT